MTENPLNLFNQTTSGEAAFQTLYVYDKLVYEFDDDEIKVKSIQASESSTFKSDIIVEGNLTSTSGLNLSGDITIGGASGHVGLATFKDSRFYGKIFDGDGDFGTSGQLLASDGTDTVWIDASSTSVANANNVGVNVNSTNADQYITFVGATSGNNPIRVDSDLKYNPSTNTIATIKINDLQVVGELKDGDGDFGTSGQVLSSDGTDTAWINAGSLTAGAAAEVGVTAVNSNSTHYITFVDSSSGNDNIKVDTNLTYNPSTNTLIPKRIEFADNDELRFGNGNDLKISHTNDLSGQNDSNGDSVLAGTDWCSYIKETGTGPLVFKSDGGPSSGAFQWYDAGWRPILKLFSGSSARAALYHAGAEKLVTSSTGVTVTGTVNATSFSGSLAASNLTGALPAISGANLTGIEAFVTGMILLWYGNTGNIPSGFVLCDGNNSTPDLRDRFVVGAGSAYSPGNTGGSSGVTLSTSQLPSHTHSLSASGTTGGGGSHRHYGFANATGGQQRTGSNLSANNFAAKGTGAGNIYETYNITTAGNDASAGKTSEASSHTHSFSLSGNTGSAGSGSSVENRPPYYALCYIMKT